jgi:hypothetical protein
MYWRWLGLLLLLCSSVIGLIIATDLKIFQRAESYAKVAETGEEVVDKIVPVPPWNASEESPPRGWVGFNVTLNHTGTVGYEVKGRILPDDADLNPKMVMRVVNETGLIYLILDNFDEYTWNSTEIYAAAFLDGSVKRLYDDFKFVDVDNSSKYVFLFRGLKNETQDRPILIGLKEVWLEEKNLLEPTAFNIIIVASTAIVGLSMLLKSLKPSRKRRSQKRLFSELRVSEKNSTYSRYHRTIKL